MLKKVKNIMALITLFLSGCTSTQNQPSTVSHVDLKRYMGKWYEIASFPNRFQRGCQCTTANYQLRGDKVIVLNRCYKGKSLKLSKAKGIAWPVPGKNNSQLKVRFFWPFTGNYWILYLSPGYQQVIVSSSNYKYLWILARTQRINQKTYNKLQSIAAKKGFDINKLVKTNQNCPSIFQGKET